MLDTLAKSIVSLSSPSPLSNQDQSITAHSKKCRQSVATQQLNRKGAKRRGAHGNLPDARETREAHSNMTHPREPLLRDTPLCQRHTSHQDDTPHTKMTHQDDTQE